MFDTATIDLASPLPISTNTIVLVQPLSFTVSDGVNTFTNLSPGLDRETFAFLTDKNGNILQWIVAVEQVINSQDIRGYFSCFYPSSLQGNCAPFGPSPFGLDTIKGDEGYMFQGPNGQNPIATNANPGTWTIRNVPEPWSLPFLTIPALAYLMLKKGGLL
jgi:hypothetical protein